MKPNLPIASPCKRQCHLIAGGCPACGRSLPEIQNWVFYTPERRADIMERALPGRLALRMDGRVPMIPGGLRLGSAQTPSVVSHLTGLSHEDRHALFGQIMEDDALTRWVNTLDWGGNWVWGVIEEKQIVGLAHLAPPVREQAWELMLSVTPSERQRGLGEMLLNAAIQVAGTLAPAGTLMIRSRIPHSILQRWAEGKQMLTTNDEAQAVFYLG